MLRSVKMADHMRYDPITVGPDANVIDVVHEIIVNKISGVCVVDKDMTILGIVSELDCLQAILNATYNETALGPVSDYMTSDLITVSPDEDIVDVARDMLKHKHRRRPVVKDGKMVGQITCRQLLRAVKEFAAPVDPEEHKDQLWGFGKW